MSGGSLPAFLNRATCSAKPETAEPRSSPPRAEKRPSIRFRPCGCARLGTEVPARVGGSGEGTRSHEPTCTKCRCGDQAGRRAGAGQQFPSVGSIHNYRSVWLRISYRTSSPGLQGERLRFLATAPRKRLGSGRVEVPHGILHRDVGMSDKITKPDLDAVSLKFEKRS